MRIARCTQDGVTYQAVDFDRTEGFETKKRFLVCPECQGPAFYRGPTRNGREACFGARPHADGCTLTTLEHDGAPAEYGGEEDEIFTTGQRIVMDLNYGTQGNGDGDQPTGRHVDTTNVGTGDRNGTAVRDFITRRMRSLLNSLIASEEFRASTGTIEVPEQGEFTITDFFVNFAEVTENHIDSYHGFWGMVPDARNDRNGTLWFNSGGGEDISVLLDQQYIEAIYQRFHIEDVDEIAGAYILVLGVLRLGPTGKKYVPISDPAYCTLRLAR